MSDFINLTCPNCGGKLQVTKEIEHFACAHCGVEHVVKRGEGIISLAPVVEGIKSVKEGVDKTTSELAIKRLQEEIPKLEAQISEKRNNTAGPLILFLIAAALIICGGAISESTIIIFGIIFFVGGMISVVSTNKNTSAAVETSEKKLQKKKEELDHHQRNVSL